MPAKSAKQKKLMDAAAHNPTFAKKVGIPVSVAKKFSKASKGQEFAKGGTLSRIGKAVTPSRRDPDFEKMIKPGSAPKSHHTKENGPLMKHTAGSKKHKMMEYAGGGEVEVRGVGKGRPQKARIC